MRNAPAVPTGPGRPTSWALVPGVLVACVVVLSSLSPFVQFASDGPSINRDDALNAFLFVLSWIPFLVVGVRVVRGPATRRLLASPWLLLIVTASLPFVPTAHTQVFFLAATRLAGGTVPATPVSFLMLSFLGALQYLAVIALVTAEASGRAREEASRAAAELAVTQAQLRHELAEVRMSALYSQLQPHFLFNTLNSISALVTSNPAGARRMLLDLSTLLRSVLENSEQSFVTLEQELRLVRSYLSIQKVRFGDRLGVHFALDEALQQQSVPPMLLQPLVENAVQYAMDGNEVNAQVLIRTSRSQERLVLEVVNSGPSPQTDGTSSRGVGLRNTRERLRQLYDTAFRLELVSNPEGSGAVARIELPLAIAAR